MDTVTDVTPNPDTRANTATSPVSTALPHLSPIPDRTLKVVDLYKAVIGPRHQAYYLNQFARQEAQPGLRLGWHWPALLSALNWFVFRKMWGTAVRYVLLLSVLGLAVWQVAVQLDLDRFEIAGVVVGVVVLVSVGAALLANALYYRHCMSLIHQVLVDGCDRDVAGEVLEAQACSNCRLSGQVLMNVACVLLLSALATFAPWSWDGAAMPATEPLASVTPVIPVTPVAPAVTDALPLASLSAPTVLHDEAQTVKAVPEPEEGLPPMLPLSEARASADAGLVLAGDPIPVPTPKAPVISESRGPRAASTAPLKQTKPPAAAAPEVAKVLPNPKTVKPKAVPASTNTAFAVQVGIFAQAANVASVKEQLQSMGLAVLTEVIKMGGETRTRVRVGPFESEVQALQTAKKITDVGLPAVLVRLPAPAGSAGASASGRVP